MCFYGVVVVVFPLLSLENLSLRILVPELPLLTKLVQI